MTDRRPLARAVSRAKRAMLRAERADERQVDLRIDALIRYASMRSLRFAVRERKRNKGVA